MEKYEKEFCHSYFKHLNLPKGVVCGCIKTPLPYCVHFGRGDTLKIKDPCGECCPFNRKFQYE